MIAWLRVHLGRNFTQPCYYIIMLIPVWAEGDLMPVSGDPGEKPLPGQQVGLEPTTSHTVAKCFLPLGHRSPRALFHAGFFMECSATNSVGSVTVLCAVGTTICCQAEDEAGSPVAQCCPRDKFCGPYYSGLGVILCLTIRKLAN